LTGVVVLTGGLARRGLEVGVVEHDKGILAPEFGRERDDVARRGLTDLARAARTDPVSATRRTSGCSTSAAPVSLPMLGRRLLAIREAIAELRRGPPGEAGPRA
jgi:hypothetical protein